MKIRVCDHCGTELSEENNHEDTELCNNCYDNCQHENYSIDSSSSMEYTDGDILIRVPCDDCKRNLCLDFILNKNSVVVE